MGAVAILQAVGLGLALLASILLARLLGAAEYGIYAYALALVTAVGIPAVIGVPPMMVRQTTVYQARGDSGLLKGLLVWSNGVSLLLAAGCLVLALSVVWLAGPADGSGFGAALVIALALLPFRALGALRAATLRGLRHTVLGQLPESLIQPGLFVACCAVAFWAYGPGGLTASRAMLLQLAAAVAAFGVGAALLVILLPPEVRGASARYATSEWRRSGFVLVSAGSLRAVNDQIGVLLLGPLAGAEAVGLYAIASRGAALIPFMLNAVNVSLAPSFAQLYSSKHIDELQRLLRQSARFILAASAPVAVLMSAYSSELLTWLFGEEFARAAWVLVILATGQLLSVATGSAGVLLNMTAHEGATVRAFAFAIVLNIVLCAILIPRFGAAGAALAVSASRIIANVAMTVAVRRQLGLDSTAVGRPPARLP